jgi:nickel transport protein
MRRLFQVLATVGFSNVTLVGLSAALPEVALALSQQAIVEKLTPVPVFLIVNGEGISLTASATLDGQTIEVPLVFVSPNEAQSYIQEAASQRPEFAEEARIAVTPLGEVYAQAATQLNNPNAVVYIPSAISMAQASEITNQEIIGVPLYAAVDLQSGTYLFTSENEVPIFFSLEDLRGQLTTLLTENPSLEEVIGVEVTSLENVLLNMATDDPALNQLMETVEFVPASRTLEFVRSLSQQQDSRVE